MKKYELFEDFNGSKYFRIRYLIDIPKHNIKKGDIGGLVEGEHNLSHFGDCVILDNALVYSKAVVEEGAKICDMAGVFGSARVFGRAIVKDNAKIYGDAIVYGQSKIYGGASIHGYAEIYGNASIYEYAEVRDSAKVHYDANVYGEAFLRGNTEVRRNADISKKNHVLNFTCGGHSLTIFREKNNKVCVACGCFTDDLDEFKERIYSDGNYKSYKNLPLHRKEYLKAIEIWELRNKEKGEK